jgi:hypothetical protein
LGEVIPTGWSYPLFALLFFKQYIKRGMHMYVYIPWGWTKEWTFSVGIKVQPWGPSSHLGANSTCQKLA